MSISLGKISLKSALLSSSIFWILMCVNKRFESFYIALWGITIIITFFFSLIMIVMTILSLYEHKKDQISKAVFFHTYFPYYAVIFFGVSAWILYYNQEEFLLYVLIAANVSAFMSWIWLFKEEEG